MDVFAAHTVVEHGTDVFFQTDANIFVGSHIFGHKAISKLRFFEFPTFFLINGDDK
ncbi:hypothetical protein D3C87_2179800 [compost metagenome]